VQLIADYHTHTNYSHGEDTIRANIEAAIDKGLDEIAIADHGPSSYSFRQFGVRDPETLLEIKEKVTDYNQYYPNINVLTAVEANIISMEGELDVPVEVLEQLDKVLVGFHLYVKPADLQSVWGIIINNALISRLKINQDEIRQVNTEIILKTLDNYDIDIITHPGYQVNLDTKLLAQKAAQRDVALEINAKHGFLTEEFVKVATREGAKFSLGSDAHSASRVGEVTPAMKLVDQLGLSAQQLINVKENMH